MTEYHRIGEWPSVLYNQLLSIQSSYGLAPEDPVQNDGSHEESRFVAVFGVLGALTGDSKMQSLYEAHRDLMLGGLDRGYTTSNGANSPTAADNSGANLLFNMYRIKDDKKIHDLLNDISNGFAGIRTDGNNWPEHSDSGYNIFANCLNGTYWGTLNQEVSFVLTMVNAYFTSDMDAYHLSSIIEDVWNVVKWIGVKQFTDGSFPRDAQNIYDENYDLLTAHYLSQLYNLMQKYGDLTYSGDSILSLLKGILDKHWTFYQNKFGVRNIALTDSKRNTSFYMVPELSVHGYRKEAIKTGLLSAYIWSKGFFRTDCPTDYRDYPLRGMQMYGDIEEYKRWL